VLAQSFLHFDAGDQNLQHYRGCYNATCTSDKIDENCDSVTGGEKVCFHCKGFIFQIQFYKAVPKMLFGQPGKRRVTERH
jgi:hypothetical protein